MALLFTKSGGGAVSNDSLNGLWGGQAECGGISLLNKANGGKLYVEVKQDGVRKYFWTLEKDGDVHEHIPNGVYELTVHHEMPLRQEVVNHCLGIPDAVPATITEHPWCSGHSFTMTVTEAKPRMMAVLYMGPNAGQGRDRLDMILRLMGLQPESFDDGNVGADASGLGYGDNG
jgi:hypothetical protein